MSEFTLKQLYLIQSRLKMPSMTNALAYFATICNEEEKVLQHWHRSGQSCLKERNFSPETRGRTKRIKRNIFWKIQLYFTISVKNKWEKCENKVSFLILLFFILHITSMSRSYRFITSSRIFYRSYRGLYYKFFYSRNCYRIVVI